MAASDYVPIFFKNRLHLAGRPQMSSRPNTEIAAGCCCVGTRRWNRFAVRPLSAHSLCAEEDS